MPPLVSIIVTTYNFAKTVVETLYSVKAQTYQRLELVVSDDCSTDDTVRTCQGWLAQNSARFERVEVVTSEVNTGVSKNCSRALSACRGEWVQIVSGDDMLMSNSITDCVEYVGQHPDTVYLFGRCQAFGASEQRRAQVDSLFDYGFFSLPPKEQLRRLTFEGNCIPAPASFFHRERVLRTGVFDDRRVPPMLEDWPKWILLLRKGVTFHFVDKVLSRYRVGGVSTSVHKSVRQYTSDRQMFYRFLLPEWYQDDVEKAVQRAVDDDVRFYKMLMDEFFSTRRQLNQVRESKAYRLGKFLLHPFKFLRRKK